MQRRKTLTLVISIIAVLAAAAWAFSRFVQPVLPPQQNADVLLFVAALGGVLAILSAFTDLYGWVEKFFARDETAPEFTPEQNRRNREILLSRVWDAWVEGVLKNSLYNEAWIALGLELRPQAVGSPWDAVLQMPERPVRQILPDQKILAIFHECSQSIVILGEPGSGKTTELLELAAQAIEAARHDPQQPAPVVFNLSTWTPKRTIHDWLADEFSARYKVAPPAARYFVDHADILYLLDGLDEVKPEYRAQCAQAINAFLMQKVVPIAICCRRKEYERLPERLNVSAAIYIQPLSHEQAVSYLRKAGGKFVDIYNRINVDPDPEAVSFLHTPLFFSILLLAYQNATEEEVNALLASADFKKHLFDTYITQMFKRRGKPIYTEGQTRKWLSWLAGKMVKYGMSAFYIENMRDHWFDHDPSRKLMLIFWINLTALFFGLVFGISFGLAFGIEWGLAVGFVFLILTAILGVLVTGLLEANFVVETKFKLIPVFKLGWSWVSIKQELGFDFRLGIIGGMVTAIILFFINRPTAVVVGLSTILSLWLILGFMDGLVTRDIDLHDQPNQSIRNSSTNSLLITVISIIVISVCVVWLFIFSGTRSYYISLFFILTFSAGLGFLIGLLYGGGFLLYHYLLRLFFSLQDKLPFRLIRFLDHAADRVLLRKVGGGYIFIHRLMLEHFAAMDA